MERSDAVKFWRHHLEVWRASGATELTHLAGMDVVEVIVVGRRSGQERSVLLTSIPSERGWVVVASNLGAGYDPNWLLNLRAAGGRCQVRAPGGEVFDAEAVELAGDELSETWARLVAVQPDYAEHRDDERRAVPVVDLRRTRVG